MRCRGCFDEDGRLAGSNIDMASEWPAAFLGVAHELGRIAPGYRANLVAVDDELNVLETWVDGRASSGSDRV
jgi:N-acetylglucosamine-6-phosphate deacetylase